MRTRADYVWEKMQTAIGCLCADGPFNIRLQNAAVDALHLIRAETLLLGGRARENLDYILRWTADNIHEGRLLRKPDDVEKGKLIEMMISVLLDTERIMTVADCLDRIDQLDGKGELPPCNVSRIKESIRGPIPLDHFLPT
jgi:hypothetical protein